MYNIEEFISGPHFSSLKKAIENPDSAEAIRELPLQSAKIKITPRCNLRCRMCGIWRYPAQPEIEAKRLDTLVEELSGLGCRKIHISGGEPLMRPDLFDFLEKCRRLKVRANLTTNGTLVTKDVAKRLIGCGARGISISIDGPSAKIHDGIRCVPGAFKAATRAIELLANARAKGGRTRIRINTVIQRRNFSHFPRIVEFAGELGVDEIEPMPVDSKRGELRLRKTEIKDFNLAIAPEVSAIREKYGFSLDPRYVFPFGQTKRDFTYCIEGDYARGFYEDRLCHAPWLHAFIAWDGEVYPCCMTRGRIQSLGNVTDNSIREVFFGEKYGRLRRGFIKKRLAFCHKCDNFLYENNLLCKAITEAAGNRQQAKG